MRREKPREKKSLLVQLTYTQEFSVMNNSKGWLEYRAYYMPNLVAGDGRKGLPGGTNRFL